jgi:hypothetical protein
MKETFLCNSVWFSIVSDHVMTLLYMKLTEHVYHKFQETAAVFLHIENIYNHTHMEFSVLLHRVFQQQLYNAIPQQVNWTQ